MFVDSVFMKTEIFDWQNMCLLSIAGGYWGKNKQKTGEKSKKTENRKPKTKEQKQVSPSEKPIVNRRGADKKKNLLKEGGSAATFSAGTEISAYLPHLASN
jgi:hypothetical protein